MKIAVAMSGGVDSSVAAALSAEKYGAENVFGVTMKLFCYSENHEPLSKGGENLEAGGRRQEAKSCCSLDAINDAASVCKQLGIPHYVVNLEKEFERDVINDFIENYRQGLTPNPCIRCNQLIKFDLLLRKVQELGADKLVTGHYARILREGIRHKTKDKKTNQLPTTSYKLLRGKDELKDQSYFLYNLNQKQLAHVEFPIGELTKTETRKLAKKYGLKTAEKTESQDICFVPGTVSEYLEGKTNGKPGDILDSVGKIVGRHNGLDTYTIGQRKGLGGGFSEIMYVIDLDVDKNEVIIGPEEALYGTELTVTAPHWVGEAPELPLKCSAKIRYGAEGAECDVKFKAIRHNTKKLVIPSDLSSEASAKLEAEESLGGTKGSLRYGRDDRVDIKVTFTTPQKAITPGQSVVFYRGDTVLGGGVISSTRKS